MKAKRVVTLALVTVFFVLAAVPAWADAKTAMEWLRAQQNDDGGFGAPESSIAATIESIYAITAAGESPDDWAQAGNTPFTYLGQNLSEITVSGGTTAKLILAVVAAGLDARDFNGSDLVATLEAMYDPATGRYGGEADTFAGHAFAMLALASVSRPISGAAVDYIRAGQTPDGSWAWNGEPTEGTGDTNSTALALQALIAAGVSRSDDAILNAVVYYRTQQNDDGGFPYQKPSDWGTDTDANSTAYSIQGLKSAGEDPTGDAWAKPEGTPLGALDALQQESGAFAWQAAMPDDNLLATTQAIAALAGVTFPPAVTTVAEVPASLPTTGADYTWVIVSLAAVGAGALGFAVRRYATR